MTARARRAMRRRLLVCLLTLPVAPPVYAQVAAPEPLAARPLVTTYDAEFLRDLPTNDSVFNAIDTLQPSIISDRFSGGGLEAGQPTRLGGFLSSWTQTAFSVDGVPINDPNGSGMPLLFPELVFWDRMVVGTGAFDAGQGAPGLAIDLLPIAPTGQWSRSVEGSASHAGLASRAVTSGPPAIARLDGWDRAAFAAAGPLRERLAGVFAASWTRASQFSRADRFPADASAGSVFSNLVFTRSSRDAIRLLGWLQARSSPLAQRSLLNQPEATADVLSGRVQAVWEHGVGFRTPWRAYAAYTGQRRTVDLTRTANGILDRLVDGPVNEFAALSNNTVQTWSLGARVEPRRVRWGVIHTMRAGADLEFARSRSSAFYSGTIGELVHQSPARVWVFRPSATPSSRHAWSGSAFISDRIALGRQVELEAGLRLQLSSGSAVDAPVGASWQALLPRFLARWRRAERSSLTAFAGYSRSAYRLRLDDLAVGDPGAPTIDVYRWNALAGANLPLSTRGALVARMGPGPGGSPSFAAIDAELKGPIANEIAIGIEGRPLTPFLIRFSGLIRTEKHHLGLLNVGAPAATSYSSFTVPDPAGDVLDPSDDRILTVYNRLPTSFGLDRYLLTNPEQRDAVFKGLEIDLEFKKGRLFLAVGGTAGMAEGSAASRGYGALENEQAVLGEIYTNPNAEALARGRLFTDRAFTGKLVTMYRFPADVRAGAIARYQDGQSFSRVVVFPGLNQGAEAVRAFPNGDSRFMFVGTLDLRVQKGFDVGNSRRIDAFLDAFNVLGMDNSVEEDVSAPPDVRIPIAVQPPRAIHVGLRLAF